VIGSSELLERASLIISQRQTGHETSRFAVHLQRLTFDVVLQFILMLPDEYDEFGATRKACRIPNLTHRREGPMTGSVLTARAWVATFIML